MSDNFGECSNTYRYDLTMLATGDCHSAIRLQARASTLSKRPGVGDLGGMFLKLFLAAIR
jgi:hypothetical protein